MPLETTGIVLDEVGKESALASAGLQPEDILISWESLSHPSATDEPVTGEFNSPFDWLWVSTEQAPRAPVRLRLTRGNHEVMLTVPIGDWDSQVRPPMNPEALDWYARSKKLLKEGKTGEAFPLWEMLAKSEHLRDERAWLYLDLGKDLAEARDFEKAQEAFRRGLKATSDPESQALIYSASAQAYSDQNDLERARVAFQDALAIRERHWGASLSTAKSIYQLATLDFSRQNLERVRGLAERALALQEQLAPRSLDFALTLHLLGRIESGLNNLDKAERFHLRALDIRKSVAPGGLAVASSLNNLAVIADKRGDLDASLAGHQRAFEIRQRLAPGSQDLAASLSNLGNVALKKGDPKKAQQYLAQSLTIMEEKRPDSPELAVIAENMGLALMAQGDFDSAAAYLNRVLQIRQKLLPDTIYFAMTLNNLGALSFQRGDLAKAGEFFSRSLQIKESLKAQKADVGASLINLGNILYYRGDLLESLKNFQLALEIYQKIRPVSLEVAASLANLGNVFWSRGEPDLAREYYTRALEIESQIAPDSLRVAETLINLGNVASDFGNLEDAFDFYRRANKIQEKLAPDSLASAASLENLGGVSLDRHQLQKAEAYFKKAFRIEKRMAPESLVLARSLLNLGDVEQSRGKLAAARRYYQLAVDLQTKLAPESIAAANGLARLAKVTWLLGEHQTGTQLFAQCIDTLEAQIVRLGSSSEARTLFRARYQAHYRDYLDILLFQKNYEEAFYLLERFRARSFLEMLAKRDLILTADITGELESSLRRIEVEYDRAQERLLERVEVESEGTFASIAVRLRELRDQYESIKEKIREASPRFSALRHPQPLDLEKARASLDPGALLLSYVVADNKCYLFVVASGRPLELIEILVGEGELRHTIEVFRTLLQKSPLGFARSARSRLLESTSRHLFDLLLRPVAARIDASSRVLIINDGPLHLLPWGALIKSTRPQDSDLDQQYVAEWKPVSTVLSATLLAELKHLRSRQSEGNRPHHILAFGDPIYRPFAAGLGTILKIDPLPFTQIEVRGIAEIFSGASDVYLGSRATEENAKLRAPGATLVHFATHTTLDERTPLNSAVILSRPEVLVSGRDNGLLQAWEIFEQVRLDADLVVLSACESGLGKEMGGEGLIGLTRAFQYAGAQSVMASLWKISDRTTAEFMIRFYRHLKGGLPKDEALRATQMEFIQGSIHVAIDKGERVSFDASAPYYWAAFQIYGDWQ